MFDKIKKIMKLPKISVNFVDDDSTGELKAIYKNFMKRHPKYKIFRNKTIGVMLYKLPKQVEEYEKSISGKNGVGYYTRRCKKMGYYTKEFKQSDYIEEIYNINTSTTQRQGHKMSEAYLKKPEKEKNKKFIKYIGVFSKNNVLVGYVRLVKTDNLFIIGNILGHNDFLKDNIMYLLLHDLTIELINEGKKNELDQYLMYDTYFGGTDGLRLFKKRNCFVPYRVRWIYENH